MNQTCIGILLFSLLLSSYTLTGLCLTAAGQTKLMPIGNHLLGLQKKQDSLQLAILSTTYLCLEKGDQSNIEFTDGSFIYISNLLELNCDGKAYFNLSSEELQQLSMKKIAKVVLGSRYEGYTTSAVPEDDQAMEFLNLMNCIINEEIHLSTPLEAVSDTNTTQIKLKDRPTAAVTASDIIIPDSNIDSPNTSIAPLRTVQFIATTGGKTFSELTYLGTLISEKVVDKNIYRYKIQGNFTDADVQHVIASLAIHGYKGAFENK